MEMKVFMEKLLLLFLCFALLKDCVVKSVPYDYSASIECLPQPAKPQYGGGVLRAAAESSRSRPSRSPSQRVQLQKDHHYVLSAWLKLAQGSSDVKAIMKIPGAYVPAGAIVAKSGCWSMLKGGLTAPYTGPAELAFEANRTVDMFVDSVSLQPFTQEEWDAHRTESILKARKKTVRLEAKDASGKPLPNAQLSVELVRSHFPFGNAMTKEILDIPAYEKWFTSRFTVATFENEMKWYSTEWRQGQEDYRVADAMLKLAQKHNIPVRGHNVFWDDQSAQMKWVSALSVPQLKAAVDKRVKSVVSRYAGKVIHWDVVNENLHFSFFENKFGKDASPQIYQQVGKLDKAPLLFMNEFNTLEQPGDPMPLPSKYIAKMKQIQSYPGNGGLRLGVGLESHFSTPNIPYMRASLDTLAQLKLPIWLTEVDVTKSPNQVKYLEQVLREGYAHPAVQGIVMWAAWHAKGCYVMCLTDNNFKNLPQGDLVDKLIAEWKTKSHVGKADAQGVFETELFHGEYKVTVSHPSAKAPAVQSLNVGPASAATYTIKV